MHERVTGRSLFWPFAVLAGLALAACSSGHSAPTSTPPSPSPSTSAPPPVTPDMTNAMRAATGSLTLAFSYDYRHLPADHTEAISHITEPFRSKFEQSWRTVEQQAPPQHAVVTASVTSVGVAAVDGPAVTVLAFLQSRATNSQLSSPRVDLNTVRATMKQEKGQWLVADVAALDPENPTRPTTAWAAPSVVPALTSAKSCIETLQTFDRTHFDTQLQAMLHCTTGPAHTQLQASAGEVRDAADTRSEIASVADVGLTTASPDQVTVLVAVVTASTYKSEPATKRVTRLVVEVKRTSGRWLVANLTSA